MAKVRRDAKGRVLRKGESYRKSQKLYVYSYTDSFGKRRSIYAKEISDLRKKEDALRKDQMDGLDVYVAGKADLNFVFDRYINSKRNLRKSTKSNYIYMYDHYVRKTIGKKKIASIKYTDIIYFYKGLLDESGLAVNTVDGLNTVLCPTFELAVKDDIIRKNPTKGAMAELKRNQEETAAKRQSLTLPEQKRFLESLDRPENLRWRPLFVVLLGTGGRIGEITGLRWSDVDMEERTISINHTLSYFEDRTGDGHHKFVISKPKTAAGIRIIPMLDSVYEALQEEKRYQKMTSVTCKEEVDGMKGFIFCNRFGGLHKPNGTNKAIARIVADYNAREEILSRKENRSEELLPHFSNHVLRHTFCTRLCERESNLKVIQYVMGHSDIRTTMNIYADVTKDKAQESFKNFSDGVDIF